jgi:hypothetical protein
MSKPSDALNKKPETVTPPPFINLTVKKIRSTYFQNPLNLTFHDLYLSHNFGLWGNDIHSTIYNMTQHAASQRRLGVIDCCVKTVSKLNLFEHAPSTSLALQGVTK